MTGTIGRKAVAVVAAAAVCAGLAGCGSGEEGEGDLLVIYSPHSEATEKEFTRAFKAYYAETTGRRVEIRWPDAGGSSKILPHIQDKARHGIHDVDIVFGGGTIHTDLKQQGLLQPYRLPDELLARLPKTVAGEPLYDPQYTWYGAAVSSFGIIVNRKLIVERGLPAVTEWTDMAHPKFLGLVGLVDASQSGSVRKAYEIILQAYGYDLGMRILTLMAANAREIGRSSSEVPRGCAQGFVAAGPCIDFYAWRQMMRPGGEVLDFVLPEGLTVMNTDPIGILREAPHVEVAREFVNFVMSPRGQMLWSLRKGVPGGPQDEALGRYAVLPEVYESRAEDLVPGLKSPLGAPANAAYDMDKETDRINILPAYLKALMVTNKRLLTEAWEAVIAARAPDASDPPEELVAELTAPLVSEGEMLRLARDVWAPVVVDASLPEAEQERLRNEEDRRARARSDLNLEWTEAFRDRFKAVAAKARRWKSR